MRAIKFRFWDGVKMQPIIDASFGNWIAVPEQVGDEEWDLTQLLWQQDKIMQFTGLVDRNGVEIYEGDVLRWQVKAVEEIAPVIFEEGCFWMGKGKNGYGVCNDWLRGEYEVLGNIYEHQELLK